MPAADVSSSPDAPEGGRPRRGRPRSQASEESILAAALDLLAAGCGPAAVSMTAIAKRAGTGKDTIYRRWTCKEDLLLDALASQQQTVDLPAEGPVREGLIAALGSLIERLQNERDRRILRGLYGAGDEFPKLRRRYQQEVLEERREKVRSLVRSGIARGELVDQGDPTQAALMPFAAVVMSALEDRPVCGDPRRAAATMIDAVLHGLAASPAATADQ